MSDAILAGRYHLVELIGEGGMAHVYRAIDQNTGHNVAIKVLKRELSQDADYVTRFQREAEAASKMTHHNIVNLLDVGMDGNDRYLVIEYVQGRTLKELIQEKGRLPASVAVQICIRILSALQHAHEQGIVHRDIKPQNILVGSDGHVKVADFGIARIANSYTLTRDDSVMGTVYYYSPEQASGEKVGATSDIYSTGIVLYEMLTGRVPFTGDTQVAIAMQHLKARPIPIEQLVPDVPPAVCHVVMRAMAKDPRNRYQNARDMAAELRMAMEGRVSEMAPRVDENTAYTPPPRKQPAAAANKPKAPAHSKPARPAAPPKPKKKRTRSQKLWAAVSILMTLIVLFGLTIAAFEIYTNVMTSTEAPNLVDKELGEAERLALRAGLHLEVQYANHPTAPAGTVTMQEPKYGTTMKKEDSIYITVSQGPSTMIVPSFINRPLTDSISLAKNNGLIITVYKYELSTEFADGTVIDQIPAAGTSCKEGDIVQVTVAGGPVTVPSVVDKTLAEAKAILNGQNLSSSGSIEYVNTADAELHGRVAKQDPAAGIEVMQNSTVYLWVYQCPTLISKAEVTLTLEESTEPISYRVTLVLDDDEATLIQSIAQPGDTRHPVVTLTAQSPGTYTYRVYCNGVFAYEKTAELQKSE